MKSGQGTVCDLSGHDPHYVPAHPRPTAPKTDPQEGKHLYITHLYLGFGLVLEIILCRGSVVFASTLCCQELKIGTVSFSRTGPLAKGQLSSYPTEVKAGWKSTWGPWKHTHMLFLKCNGETQDSAV